jgi:hypothetical protein
MRFGGFGHVRERLIIAEEGGGRQRTEGRKQKAESRRQRAESRRQRAENKNGRSGVKSPLQKEKRDFSPSFGWVRNDDAGERTGQAPPLRGRKAKADPSLRSG